MKQITVWLAAGATLLCGGLLLVSMVLPTVWLAVAAAGCWLAALGLELVSLRRAAGGLRRICLAVFWVLCADLLLAVFSGIFFLI